MQHGSQDLALGQHRRLPNRCSRAAHDLRADPRRAHACRQQRQGAGARAAAAQVQEIDTDRYRGHGAARCSTHRTAGGTELGRPAAHGCCWRCPHKAKAMRSTKSSEPSRESTPAACILTKVDEAASLGAVISAVLRHKLRIAYVCDGQRVPEDLHAAHQQASLAGPRRSEAQGTRAARCATKPIVARHFSRGRRPCVISDFRRSELEALAELNSTRPVKVIAVTGGKGGVGKTTVSANLAVSIAAQGRDVMLVDADLGLANVDVVLGLHTRFHLGQRDSGRVRTGGCHRHRPARAANRAGGFRHQTHGDPVAGRARRASSAPSAICITASRCWWSIPRRGCTTAS